MPSPWLYRFKRCILHNARGEICGLFLDDINGYITNMKPHSITKMTNFPGYATRKISFYMFFGLHV